MLYILFKRDIFQKELDIESHHNEIYTLKSLRDCKVQAKVSLH